jgi:hypothetical protein
MDEDDGLGYDIMNPRVIFEQNISNASARGIIVLTSSWIRSSRSSARSGGIPIGSLFSFSVSFLELSVV